MSLISKMLDDLDDRQADLAGERDPVLQGLQKVTDTNFHRGNRRVPLIVGTAVVVFAATLVLAVSFGLLPLPGRAPAGTVDPPVTSVAEPLPAPGVESSGAATAAQPGVPDPTTAAERPAQTAAPRTSPSRLPAALSDWAVKEDDGGASVILRLTEKVGYRLYPALARDRVTLEFAGPLGRADTLSYSAGQGLVRSIVPEPAQDGATRFELRFARPVDLGRPRERSADAAFDLELRITALAPVAASAPQSPAPAVVLTSEPGVSPRPESAGATERTQAVTATVPAIPDNAAAEPGFSRMEVTADDIYRKGLQLYQAGKIQEGMAQLARALEKDPLHTEARTTLASCLVEQREAQSAIDLLEQGLQLAPRQYKWAELKAHLQVDAGEIDAAIATLQRERPTAGDNPDYLGFLAALLQRQNRHEEAAALYEAIVRVKPGNGIWWMGLGISLERIDKTQEAKNAYQQALADSSLSPDLRGYINKRIMSLSRR